MARYDDSEALRTLGQVAEETDPDASTRQKAEAANELLAAVAELKKLPGLETRRDGDSVWIGTGVRTVRVLLARGSHFLVATDSDRAEVPLVFNRSESKWESKKIDDSLVPVPGDPKIRRRSALAEIATYVAKALRG
jgi:hypothetical protein